MMISSTRRKEWTGLIRTMFNKKKIPGAEINPSFATLVNPQVSFFHIFPLNPEFISHIYFTVFNCCYTNFLGNTSGDYQ